MEIAPGEILWAIALPLLWAAIAWAVWGWRGERVGAIAAGLAVVGAYALGFWAMERPRPFPPADSYHWLFWNTFPLAVLVTVEALLLRRSWAWKIPIWVIAGGLVVWLVSTNLRRNEEGVPAELWGLIAGAFVASLLMRGAIAWTARGSAISAVWVVGLTTAFTAGVVGMSGSHIGPFRAGAMALSFLPVLAVLLYGWFRRRPAVELPGPALTVWTTVLAGILLAHKLYFTTTLMQVLLLAAAPLASALIPPGRKGWKWGLARVGLAMIPVGIAFTLALLAFLKSQRESAEYGY